RGAVQAPAVLLLTHSHHRIVDYAVESITSSLVGKGIAPVLLFRDGFEPCRDRATNSSWQWCDGFPFVALGQESGALCTMLRFAFSRQGLQLIPRILFVYRRVLRSRSTDWRVKLLLLRKLPLLIVRLHRAFTYARDLIAQVAPVGILNCDNGSEDLYVKAFAYQSAQENIPFYRYKPVPSFPVPQPAFSSIASHMLATSEDEVIYRQGEAACEFWYVGSPLMDGAASYVSGIKRGSIGARIARDRLNVLYFTKRDFPNVDVVTAIAGYCQKRDTLAEIIVKMHPSDDDGSTTYGYLASEVPDFGNSIMITYYAKQDVGRVDELLSQADIVVTGSSNVIWSAFAQFKSVIYLAFRGMSSEGHILGYSKYATSDFVAISLLSEL
ncbi:MAG: hypothetical protein QGG64_00645, partial [Candidatus Latescibacteria bacterium]|nr:hypothetical protein [Candidatus Latescibacterota bacterium]